MKSMLLAVLFTFIAFTFSTQAQVKPPGEPKSNTPVKVEPNVKEPVTKDPPANETAGAKEYAELLAKLKKGDTKIDFAKLRLLYTETSDYSPYGGGQLRGMMLKSLNSDNFKEAAEAAEEMLKTNYVDLHAHLTLSNALDKLNRSDEAEFHSAVFDGLMAAIRKNDGLTAATAMISIGISEQYLIMEYMGYEQRSKALTRENGSMFDVHTAYNPEKRDTRKFYFNIDKVFGRF